MTRYDVTLEQTAGPNETIDVGENETVLEAAGRAGVRLPYDCRKGTCLACVGELLAIESGDEDADSDAGGAGGADGTNGTEQLLPADAFAYRRSPAALTDGERADGYVLLCIAMPRADCRVRVGPRVRSEVGDSPWA